MYTVSRYFRFVEYDAELDLQGTEEENKLIETSFETKIEYMRKIGGPIWSKPRYDLNSSCSHDQARWRIWTGVCDTSRWR